MEKESELISKDDMYKRIIEEIKKEKKKTVDFLTNARAIGTSEFSEGYNTALIHIENYLK